MAEQVRIEFRCILLYMKIKANRTILLKKKSVWIDIFDTIIEQVRLDCGIYLLCLLRLFFFFFILWFLLFDTFKCVFDRCLCFKIVYYLYLRSWLNCVVYMNLHYIFKMSLNLGKTS